MIRAGSLDVHYQLMAPAAAATERLVVMLHGLLIGSLAEWYFTAAPAIARRRPVLLYDLRGHGRTSRAATGYRLADLSADLGALLDALGIVRPVDLVGHSYGALVALRHALDRPRDVSRLALVEAPLPPSTMGELASLDGQGLLRLAEALPEPHRAALRDHSRRARRMLESLAFLSRGSSLLADMRAERDIADEDLARLAIPTLALYGSRSRCRPAGERLRRVLPRAQHLEIDGGHFLPIEKAAEVAAHLESFLGPGEL